MAGIGPIKAARDRRKSQHAVISTSEKSKICQLASLILLDLNVGFGE